jgi:hypothetical protein
VGSRGLPARADREPAERRWVRRDLALTAAASVAVALAVTGGSFGPGVLLYRDFVGVPRPRWSAATWGGGSAPRAVPLDAVTTALAPVLPVGVQQQLMLVGAVFLASLGAGVLVRRWGPASMVVAAVVAGWNPFVAERLLVGQPPTLLAYSMLPWVVVVVRSRLSGWRAAAALLLAALPAALTPWGGLTAAVVALVVSLLTERRRNVRWLVSVGSMAVAWCLPWLLAAVVHRQGAADPDGARAFAAGADTPLGTLGSLLTLGGIWAPAARPASRGTAVAVAAGLVLVVLAAAGLARLTVRDRRLGRLVAAAWLVPVLAAWAVSAGPGLDLFAALQAVPGVAIGRDTHRWLAPTTLAAAVLLASLVARRGSGSSADTGEPRGPGIRGAAVATALASVALLSVPDLPRDVRAAYRPVAMPPDWQPAVDAASRAAGDGALVVLPWQPFRRVRWAGADPFLDPTSRAVPADVVGSRQLTVVRDGAVVVVDDDPAALAALGGSDTLDAATLRRAGVAAVLVWKGTPGRVPGRGEGVVVERETPHFAVWTVTR